MDQEQGVRGERAPVDAATTATLVEHHRRFLAFLERRVESREAAEEILQNALVRAIEKGDQIHEPERVVAWFFRALRNAVVDHYRRRAARDRRDAAIVAERDAHEPDPELHDAVCACFAELIPTLKPEYAEVLREVELHERPLVDVARALGISVNNATVRLHRARRALRVRLEELCHTCATHGCLDCSCDRPS